MAAMTNPVRGEMHEASAPEEWADFEAAAQRSLQQHSIIGAIHSDHQYRLRINSSRLGAQRRSPSGVCKLSPPLVLASRLHPG